MISYVRKIIVLILAFIGMLTCCGCEQSTITESSAVDFCVSFIDVGQGDSIFIKLPDNKTMLIDTGFSDVAQNNFSAICDNINAFGRDKIDFLILTHPDNDHIGNAVKIIERYEIGKCYLPFVTKEKMQYFPLLESASSLLALREVETIISDNYKYIKGDRYQIAFLSPFPSGLEDSSYDKLNASNFPEDYLVNDVSPIIYANICGVKFMFTGDAGISQEKLVVNNFRSGVYSSIFSRYGINVDIKRIDYLKVSHHGAQDCSGYDFISEVYPSNAVISCGGDNYYGHPSTAVLETLITVNSDCNILRTDICGTISVKGIGDNVSVVLQSEN